MTLESVITNVNFVEDKMGDRVCTINPFAVVLKQLFSETALQATSLESVFMRLARKLRDNGSFVGPGVLISSMREGGIQESFISYMEPKFRAVFERRDQCPRCFEDLV
jgi:hypothetical protein